MSWMNGILITFISKLEWGTVADWVSGIGSFGAVIVALWQIIIQRKKEEKDRKLANRPFFSLARRTYLKEGIDELLLLPKDNKYVLRESFYERKNENNLTFKKKIGAYEFTNVSQAVATSLVFKIEYLNEASDKILRTDYCKIGKCVMGNEEDMILPTSIIHEPSTYASCPKNVYLYFTSIDDRAYCQKWIEKKSELGSIIKEIPKEEIPSKRIYSYSSLTVES